MEEYSVVEGCSVGLERLENSRIASAKTFGEILLTNHCQDQTCDGEISSAFHLPESNVWEPKVQNTSHSETF